MSRATGPVLVTGAAGFIGRQLMRHLAAHGVTAYGVDRVGSGVLHADLTDRVAVAALVEQVRPATVLHLAGAIATADAAQLHSAHIVTTDVLFGALAALDAPQRVLVLGTAAEYGALDDAAPIPEGRVPQPTSPYGHSKLAQSELAATLGARYGFELIRARLFNTLGPGQTEKLVAGAMVRRLYEALHGLRPTFDVFDPHSVRDFLDVRDVARLIWLVTQRLEAIPPHPLHIASGVGTSIGTLADLLLATAGVRASDVALTVHPGRSAPTCAVGAATTLATLLDGPPADITPAVALKDMWEAVAAGAATA